MVATSQKLIFVHGKGGVGKSYLATGLAQALQLQGKQVLLATLDEPTLPSGHHDRDGIDCFNCMPEAAFEEYIERTLKVPAITKLLAKNTLIQLLAKIAPGIKEIVSIGKIWSMRDEVDHLIVDLPSSGYGLSLFHSVKNFMKLFGKGKSFEDSRAMLETLSDPKQVLHLLVTLPEEMPLAETEDVRKHLLEQFPGAQLAFALNRLMPFSGGPTEPYPSRSAEAFIVGKALQEKENLSRFPWTEGALRFDALENATEIWKRALS